MRMRFAHLCRVAIHKLARDGVEIGCDQSEETNAGFRRICPSSPPVSRSSRCYLSNGRFRLLGSQIGGDGSVE